MRNLFRRRNEGESIHRIHGTASFAGGLFKDHFPTTTEVVAVLRALLASSGTQRIELEGAILYGWGHEQLVLGRALAELSESERARIDYITKVGRILVPAREGLESGQPPGIWPPGATLGLRRESWGFGRNDTDITLATSTLLLGGHFSAAYLHDPPDCMQEMGLSFEEWWKLVNGEGPEQGGGVIRALVEARASGIIRHIGVGVKEVEILEQLLQADCNLWDRFSMTRYNLMSQTPFLDFVERNDCRKRDRTEQIELISAGAYAGGILSNDPRNAPDEKIFCNYRLATAREIKVGRLIWDLAQKHGMPNPMPAAIQFVAKQQWLSAMVLGPRDPQDVKSNDEYLHLSIPPEFWSELTNLKVDGEYVIDRRVTLV